MKITKLVLLALACSVSLTLNTLAETVHQKADGDAALKGDGKSAKEVLEVKPSAEAGSGKLVRVKGTVGQWDYVAYWFGLRVPAGDSILRFHIFNDGGDTASYMIYLKDANGQTMLGKLEIPASAPKDSFVNVDFPVKATDEWSGVIVKKADKSANPSPWIDTVSAVLP